MAYGRQICYDLRLKAAYVARTSSGSNGRQGCTSITHTLTKADVLLEVWRSYFARERDLEVILLVANWCRIKRSLGSGYLYAGAEKRYGPSVSSVVGEMHGTEKSAWTTDCNARFIGGRPSICGFPGDESTSTRAIGRETTGAWPKQLLVSANWQLREASQQQFVIALRGKNRLRTTLHTTLDSCRLLFLGRRPLPLE